MRNKTMGSLALVGFDSIFGNGASDTGGECIMELSLADLYPPEFHPFQVGDDAAMERLVRSIKKYGVREPGLARPREDGGYELIAGNRRKRACELAKLATMPVIIRDPRGLTNGRQHIREGLGVTPNKQWIRRAESIACQIVNSTIRCQLSAAGMKLTVTASIITFSGESLDNAG